jgi:hypothetical protein
VAGDGADPEEQDLCTVYAEYLETVDAIGQVDLDQLTAGEARELAENAVGSVRHLGAVADTRYGTQIDQLEAALDDLVRVLASIEEDADPSTWQPLVEEDVEDAQHAATRVSELIDPTCQPQPQD